MFEGIRHMSIYYQSFMHKAPVASLRAYFSSVSARAFAAVDWQAPRPSLVRALTPAIVALDDATRDQIYSDIDRVGQFMNEHGRRALRDVLPADPELLASFDALEDVTACAVFVMMRNRDVFEHALSALFTQRLLNGRD